MNSLCRIAAQSQRLQRGACSFQKQQQQHKKQTSQFAFSLRRQSTLVGMNAGATNESARNSGYEIALAGALAFCTTAALIYSFPSSAPAALKHTSDPGGGGGLGGGGLGGGGEGGPLATMAFALQEEPAYQKPRQKKTIAASQEQGREKPYDISVRAVKGGRVTMEDEFFVAEGGRFVAVFDGHGGGGVSQYLKQNLYTTICHFLKQRKWSEYSDDITTSGASKKPTTPSVFSHVAALKAAFGKMDKDVLANESLGYQGSTAVAVLLHESQDGHRTLLSANVGDSRAILSRQGRAVDLTRDHKPNEEKEKARILSMGEEIEWDRFSKVHRVRNLSLSRAIGDSYAKPVVSGEVEIKHFPVQDGDEFVLLASDGLWDVMTSEDAVSYVHERIAIELARENIAQDDIENYKVVLRRSMSKFVAREAIRRGSGDNVCVIIVWLKDLKDAA